MTNFHGDEAKKIFFFEKKKLKWPTQKNCVFQLRQKLSNFNQNFMDGELILLNLYGRQAVRRKLKKGNFSKSTILNISL